MEPGQRHAISAAHAPRKYRRSFWRPRADVNLSLILGRYASAGGRPPGTGRGTRAAPGSERGRPFRLDRTRIAGPDGRTKERPQAGGPSATPRFPKGGTPVTAPAPPCLHRDGAATQRGAVARFHGRGRPRARADPV